ncbi:MAG: efflux RND transporter permease subunit [Bacteroidales bacterium]|jgi:HAE1 family hydrophobic/amphiphilic exporter-1|nr:efflux RND transporter permease subunit [Bacteroidales bacterium]
MPNIIESSIKRPLVVVVIFTLLTLGGVLCYNLLNLNLLPSIDVPVISIVTAYPGAGAAEVETSVTRHIEDAVSSLENLSQLSSTSREGVSIVVIRFRQQADIDRSVQEAQRRINAIRAALPRDILDPSIDKISLEDQPILRIAAFSTMLATEFHSLVEERIQPRLAKLPGVAVVNVSGGSEREIAVNIDAERLKSYNISIVQVFQAIQNANVEIPAGSIETKDDVFTVRLAAKFTDLDQLRRTVIVSSPALGEVSVSDIAEVHDGVARPSFINRINGQEAIGLTIQRQTDANTVRVSDLVKAELQSIEHEYAADGVRFEITNDDSIFVRAAANAVVFDLMLAIFIVSIVCFVFLHNLRSALIIMVTVPLSIVPAFIALYVMGYSLNMMSLLALSLVVCILVDDSIVIVENIYLHLEMGKSKLQAAIDGCKQIMFAVVAMSCVVIVVIMPLAVTQGMIGNVLREFAVPIIVCTLVSLLASFILTPLLMARFGKYSNNKGRSLVARFSRVFERGFESVRSFYVSVLTFGLRHKVVVILGTFALLVASLSLFPLGLIGFAFTPEIDDGSFMIQMEMSPQTTLYANNLQTMEVEKLLLSRPEVKNVFTAVGSNGQSLIATGSINNATAISVELIDKSKRDISTSDFARTIQHEINQIAGIRARIITGNNDPIQLIVQGADYAHVEAAAARLLEIVRSTPGTADARLSIDDPHQEVQISLNRERMAALALSPADVGIALRMSLAGNTDLKYSEGDFEYTIRVAIDDFDKTKLEDIARLTFVNNRGEIIELNQFATLAYGMGPSMLERTDRIASITVRSNVVNRPVGTVGSEITAAMQGQFPEGITIVPSGALEQQADAFGSLGIAFLAAIVLIYLIMVILYNSLIDPLVVLVSVPLAMIGAFFALALTLSPMTIFSIIGLIVLIAEVSKNAILLIDFAKTIRKEQGIDIFDALVEAGKERLRPILMTCISTICGMLPIALAIDSGAELKNGMAWVIIGGLTSSILLTLVVVPVVYLAVDRVKSRIFGRKSKLQKPLTPANNT